MNLLLEKDVFKKIQGAENDCHKLLIGEAIEIPSSPGRNISIVCHKQKPQRKGLSTLEGQGLLLHDLASIELQATELAVRTLAEFPLAPPEFRERLAEIALEESQHLQLCLESLESLGFKWGDWPTHLSLWNACSEEDDLLDRIIIVHRYLEGSGLDASSKLMRRLSGVKNCSLEKVIKTIAFEEEAHVSFGSEWYRKICEYNKLDSDFDFVHRMERIKELLPKRFERLDRPLRQECGYSEVEINYLEKLRLELQ